MPEFIIHVPFKQYDEYKVDADSVAEAVEIARGDPAKRTDINVDCEIEYDWDSAIVINEDEVVFDCVGDPL